MTLTYMRLNKAFLEIYSEYNIWTNIQSYPGKGKCLEASHSILYA